MCMSQTALIAASARQINPPDEHQSKTGSSEAYRACQLVLLMCGSGAVCRPPTLWLLLFVASAYRSGNVQALQPPGSGIGSDCLLPGLARDLPPVFGSCR